MLNRIFKRELNDFFKMKFFIFKILNLVKWVVKVYFFLRVRFIERLINLFGIRYG